MENDQKPVQPANNKTSARKNAIIYGILILALIATWAYIYWDKNRNNQKQQELQEQVIAIDSSRSEVQEQFQAALVKVDMLKSENDSLMKTKSKEIGDLKARIQNILAQKNTSQADLSEAHKLIEQLNSQINGYKEEIEKLKGEKIVLTNQRDSIQKNYNTVSAKNDTLNQQVSLASILRAADFKITPIHVKNSGKEKETDRAKRVDILRISFNIVKNLVSDSGSKTLYVCINAPDGTPIAVEKLGSGKFQLSDGTMKLFTAKKVIQYQTGKEQTVTIDWNQPSDFQPGEYHIEVYEKGHLIGQGKAELKKSGFIF